MTKASKLAAVPAPVEPTAEPVEALRTDVPTIRDEFAMRIAATLIGAIVQRGGTYAVEDAYGDDDLMKTAYFYADMAMRVRAQP